MTRFISILFLLTGISNLVNAQDSTIVYGDNAKAGHYADIRGFKMYYEEYGKGAPLLMIHGLFGSIGDFSAQIPYFSKKYHVIVADNRSHGKSTDNSDSLSPEQMADDLNALLNTLQIDSCYVIGWSVGGDNGLLLAIRHPEKVKKLAVTGALLKWDTNAIDRVVYCTIKHNIDTLLRLHKKSADNSHTLKLSSSVLNIRINIKLLHSIKCPTLVIAGDHDIIRNQHSVLIEENIAESYLWLIPNSGHGTPAFYPDDFNKNVETFFEKPYRKISGMSRFE